LALHRAGFAWPPRRRDAGALLPHPFTFACARLTCGRAIGRVFLWHFPAGFPGWRNPPPCPVVSGLSSRGFLSPRDRSARRRMVALAAKSTRTQPVRAIAQLRSAPHPSQPPTTGKRPPQTGHSARLPAIRSSHTPRIRSSNVDPDGSNNRCAECPARVGLVAKQAEDAGRSLCRGKGKAEDEGMRSATWLTRPSGRPRPPCRAPSRRW